MQKASSADKEYVLVEHSFDYTAKDGTLVSIKPHERYILLKKTNEHWWQVCQDYKSKPFYIPAKYVKVLSPFSQNYTGMLPTNSEETRDVPCTEYSYKFLPAKGGANLQRSSIALGAATNSLCDISIIREDFDEGKPLPGKKDTGHALGPMRTFQNSKKILDPLKRISYMCPPEFQPSIRPSQSLNDLHVIKSEPPIPRPRQPGIQVKIEPLFLKERHVAGANEDSSSEKVIHTEPPAPCPQQPGIQTEMEQLAIQKRPEVGAKKDPSPEKVVKSVPPVPCPRQMDVHGGMEPMSIQKINVAESGDDFSPEKNYTGLFRTSSEKTMEFSSLSPREGASTNLQRSSMALGAASRSLGDISMIKEDSDEDKQLLDKRDTGHFPLKRISNRCSPAFQPSIRASQSLNDLQAIESEPLVPCSRQPDVQDGIKQLSIQESHADEPKGDSSPGKVVDEKEESFYVNLEEFRKDRDKPRSSQPLSSSSTLDDWETYTDQGSGQQFYYNSVTGETTWDCPFDQAEEQPITPASLSPAAEDSSWEKHFDESTGQFYFHNPVTGETSWDPPAQDDLNPPGGKPVFPSYDSMERRPPTPEADYPEYPAQDIVHFPEADYDGLYMSPPYMAPSEEHLSAWPYVKGDLNLYTNYNGDSFSPPDLPRGRTDSNQNSMVITSWRHSNIPTFSLQKDAEVKGLEKAGLLQKAKVVEHGKRLRKNWSTSWTVLEGGILTFFRDTKNLSSNSLKQPSLMTIPEHTVKLNGASLKWASKEKSSKKHVMELKTTDGSEYLIHHDSEMITTDWFTSIRKCIGKDARIPSENTSENENESLQEFGSTEKLGMKDEKKGQNTDSDRNVRAKLRKFLQRRPTLQSLRDKGYIRDQVFGCELQHLCDREKRTVPQFVCKSIQAVEKRGLDIDGLYRVSGNLATIQKLRHKVDHDENFNLEDGKWEDVHVITGALKLFFRELPEPLFPFSHFSDFVEAIKLSDQSQKQKRMKELVLTLPSPNLETMRLLFRHLCSVIEHRDSNRMSVQSVAIVFGPTLLKPAEEGANIAMYMVFQNQIVEHILNQYKYIFS